MTDFATISELRNAVDEEVAALNLSPLDRADATSLLNVLEALLRERIGKDEIDADAVIRVNEYLAMIVAALPAGN